MSNILKKEHSKLKKIKEKEENTYDQVERIKKS
jgi:hypothetical protein